MQREHRFVSVVAASLLVLWQASGQVKTLLTETRDVTGQNLSLSRDGAYIFSKALYRLRADGTGIEKLDLGVHVDDCGVHPRFVGSVSPSADGSKLVFWEFEKRRDRLTRWRRVDLGAWVVDLSKKTRTRLEIAKKVAFVPPLMSGDGQKVVYFTFEPLGAKGTFIVNSDGSGRTPIKPSSFMAVGVDATGSRVVGGFQGQGDVWILNTDSTGLRNLTNTPSLAEGSAVITPDGKKVVFIRFHGNPTVASEVMIVNADGTGLRSLARLAGQAYRMSITANATLIAVGTSTLSLVRGDKGGVAAVFPEGFPALSGRGTRLLGLTRGGKVIIWDYALPDLKALGPERIGNIETFQVAAKPGRVFTLALSDMTASIPLPPFGTLGLDPRRLLILGQGSIDNSSVVRLPVPLPADSRLVGHSFFAQALAFPRDLSSGAVSNVVEIRPRK